MRYHEGPHPGIKTMPPALKSRFLNHWTTIEVPTTAVILISCAIKFPSFSLTLTDTGRLRNFFVWLKKKSSPSFLSFFYPPFFLNLLRIMCVFIHVCPSAWLLKCLCSEPCPPVDGRKNLTHPLPETCHFERGFQDLLLFSCSMMYDSLLPHGLQHIRLPCPSPSPGVCSNSCSLRWWCHPPISSSVIHFSSCL